jgi:Fe-S-cluster-containing dehydrogenase component/DMSO reductase anchor subunit
MERSTFLFDVNKCVGCMACVAGCIIENGTVPTVNWRVVSGCNGFRHPDLPVFWFSLACNHCKSAPCMKNCPALAYSRDEATGAVIHHAERCIGCQYCTWVCPYDAPKFNPGTRVVEKCNFCVDRLHEGSIPACAAACPVGALGFGDAEANAEEVVVPGFGKYGIKPSIRLVPLRETAVRPVIWNSDVPVDRNEMRRLVKSSPSKIRLAKEWPLVPFTLAVAGLAALLAARLSTGIFIDPAWFLSAGALAMILSATHLGRKGRAWRSVLNLRKSWLSREIFSFSAFLGVSALYFLTGWILSGYIALVFGIASLISIDMVYRLTGRRDEIPVHSAMVTLTGLLIWSILSGNMRMAALLISIKAFLYLFRKIRLVRAGKNPRALISFMRLASLALPFIVLIAFRPIPGWMLLVVLFLGEVTDRAEFYDGLEVETPERLLEKSVHP